MASPTPERVLLTDGGSKSTLTAVRSLAQRGIEVHVAAETSLAIALWSRWTRRRHRVPSPRTDPRGFSEAIARLQRREGFTAVIPVSDYDIAALMAHPEPWREAGVRMALPPEAAFAEARDKRRMMRCAMRAGVPCPETWFPDEEPIERIRDRARYPLLIKPDLSDGARGITLVEHPEALEATYAQVVERWGPSHLQEFIPEGGDQLKSDILVGAGGEILGLFVCRKIRYYPVKGGSSTLIVSEHHAQIERDVPKLVRALGWYGFADFDFIVDPRDGVAKLMECNPRFPESLRVNVFAGADYPWALYQLASTGRADPIMEFTEGRYARFLVGDLMWFLHSEDRWRARPSWFWFVGRDLTYYIERLDDPGPTICYMIEALRTIISPRRMAYRFGRGFRRTGPASGARPTT